MNCLLFILGVFCIVLGSAGILMGIFLEEPYTCILERFDVDISMEHKSIYDLVAILFTFSIYITLDILVFVLGFICIKAIAL